MLTELGLLANSSDLDVDWGSYLAASWSSDWLESGPGEGKGMVVHFNGPSAAVSWKSICNRPEPADQPPKVKQHSGHLVISFVTDS